MKVEYQGSCADDQIISVVTASICDQLPGWYGGTASLRSLRPEFLSYTSSFFLRYYVALTGQEDISILVKFRRQSKMKSLSEALAATDIHTNMLSEFDTLRNSYDFFLGACESFKPVRPLAYLDAYPALVIEQYPGLTLRQLILGSSKRFSRRRQMPQLRDAAIKSGQWLRQFQFGMHAATTTPFTAAHARAEIEPRLHQLKLTGPGRRRISEIDAQFQRAASTICGHDIQLSNGPEDFTTDNVIYGSEGTLGVIDIKRRPAPVLKALGVVLTHPDTYKHQFLTFGAYLSGGALRTYRRDLLAGYLVSDMVEAQIINFYCAASVLDKWAMYEKIVFRHVGAKAILSSVAAVFMRRYFFMKVTSYLKAATAANT